MERYELPGPVTPRPSDVLGHSATFVASNVNYVPAATAVRPPPPMPAAMQAAFAAAGDPVLAPQRTRRDVGYDVSLASMKTSWEVEQDEVPVRPWIPAASHHFLEAPSAVCPAPNQPALVAAALAEARRPTKAPPAGWAPVKVPSSSPLTSWEREAELLRHMHIAGEAARNTPVGFDWGARGNLAEARAEAVAGLPNSTQIGDLKRLVHELDSMWSK